MIRIRPGVNVGPLIVTAERRSKPRSSHPLAWGMVVAGLIVLGAITRMIEAVFS